MARSRMSKCLNSTLILRSARSARLEGWPQAPSVPPPFETPPLAAPQGEVSWLWRWPLLAVLVLFTFAGTAFAAERKLDIGRVATPQEIAGWDIDVRPDGQGLPPGRGSVKDGEAVYMSRCAACHGEFGAGAGGGGAARRAGEGGGRGWGYQGAPAPPATASSARAPAAGRRPRRTRRG